MSSLTDIARGIQSPVEEIYLHYELSDDGKALTITNCDSEEERLAFDKTLVETVVLDCILPSDCREMFYEYGYLYAVNCTENFSSSNVTNMSNMFCLCDSLQQLDTSNWDTSNVEDMQSMFSYCDSLQQLDVSNWDVSSVTDMSRMFYECDSLQRENLPEWALQEKCWYC